MTLPIFHEHDTDPTIPEGYGIDENHDGGFYPYVIYSDFDVPENIFYIPDEKTGLDMRLTSYADALEYIMSAMCSKEAR